MEKIINGIKTYWCRITNTCIHCRFLFGLISESDLEQDPRIHKDLNPIQKLLTTPGTKYFLPISHSFSKARKKFSNLDMKKIFVEK